MWNKRNSEIEISHTSSNLDYLNKISPSISMRKGASGFWKRKESPSTLTDIIKQRRVTLLKVLPLVITTCIIYMRKISFQFIVLIRLDNQKYMVRKWNKFRSQKNERNVLVKVLIYTELVHWLKIGIEYRDNAWVTGK